MTLAIPTFQKIDPGRFDFRVPDGIGGYQYPDWDANLKIEFRDSGGTLRFTATTSSSPALTQGSDATGEFVTVEALDLTTWDAGTVEAKVYAQISAANVLPYPTIFSGAFEIVDTVSEEPLYTTTGRVTSELPNNLPDELTEDHITTYIADASREVDGALYQLYGVPFAGIGDSPATPSLIEQAARKLAAGHCLVFMGQVNAKNPNVKKEEGDGLLDDLFTGKKQIAGKLLFPVQAEQIARSDDSEDDIWWD